MSPSQISNDLVLAENAHLRLETNGSLILLTVVHLSVAPGSDRVHLDLPLRDNSAHSHSTGSVFGLIQ